MMTGEGVLPDMPRWVVVIKLLRKAGRAAALAESIEAAFGAKMRADDIAMGWRDAIDGWRGWG